MAVTAVASTTTSTTLLSASQNRHHFIIENSDPNRLYVLLGSGTASSSNYSFSLAQYANASRDGYCGPITGVWEADGTGNALVTENLVAGR